MYSPRPGGAREKGPSVPVRRSVTRAAVCAAAGAWAATMVLTGLWFLFSAPLHGSMFPRAVGDAAGVTLVFMGQFTFLKMVADRVFPNASRGLTSTMEVGCFLIFAAGAAATVWPLVAGGGL